MNAYSSASGNKEIVRRFVEEAVNRDRVGLVDRLVHADYIFHCPDGDLYGPNGARLHLAELRSAFPDLHMDLIDLVGEGDLVARRFVLRGLHVGPFMGLAPSDDRVAIPGMGIDRIEEGRIAESWLAFNVYSLLHAAERALR
jgi:predicted ester cyclase